MFSKTCTYAIKIVIHLANRHADGKDRSDLKDITEGIDSPMAFTAKVLQQLTRSGITESTRGRSGGISLSSPLTVSMADVIQAIDGDALMSGCLLGFKECSDSHPCPMHHKYKPIRAQLKTALINTSMNGLASAMATTNSHLKEPSAN